MLLEIVNGVPDAAENSAFICQLPKIWLSALPLCEISAALAERQFPHERRVDLVRRVAALDAPVQVEVLGNGNGARPPVGRLGVGVGAGQREAAAHPPRDVGLQRVVLHAAQRPHDVDRRHCPQAVDQAGLVERLARRAAADLSVVEVLVADDVVLAVADVGDLRRDCHGSWNCADTLNIVIWPRMNVVPCSQVVTPAPAGRRDAAAELRSTAGNGLKPCAMLPTGVNEVAPFSRMAISAGNVRSWPRPMLLFCGLREKPARSTIASVGAVGDADARREEVLLHRDAARLVVAADAADEQPVGREVEHFHAAVGAHRHRVVLPAQAHRQRQLLPDLPLIAHVEAVLPAAQGERPILIARRPRSRAASAATTAAGTATPSRKSAYEL